MQAAITRSYESERHRRSTGRWGKIIFDGGRITLYLPTGVEWTLCRINDRERLPWDVEYIRTRIGLSSSRNIYRGPRRAQLIICLIWMFILLGLSRTLFVKQWISKGRKCNNVVCVYVRIPIRIVVFKGIERICRSPVGLSAGFFHATFEILGRNRFLPHVVRVPRAFYDDSLLPSTQRFFRMGQEREEPGP